MPSRFLLTCGTFISSVLAFYNAGTNVAAGYPLGGSASELALGRASLLTALSIAMDRSREILLERGLGQPHLSQHGAGEKEPTHGEVDGLAGGEWEVPLYAGWEWAGGAHAQQVGPASRWWLRC